MKRIFAVTVCLLPLAFALSCQKTYTVAPLSAVQATPTDTPSFSCPSALMMTPNPWSGPNPVQILPPSFTGPANIKVQIFDSTYVKVREMVYAAVFFPTALSLNPMDTYGNPLPNGNYFLVVTTPNGCYEESFSRVPLPTPTFTMVPTISCSSPTPTPGAPPNGIYWQSALLEGITASNGVTTADEIYAVLHLSVNGNPESTAGVTYITPGGLRIILSYTGTTVQSGNTYAVYQVLAPMVYQPGGAYVLTANTSLGTASATLSGPGNITIASHGLTDSWIQPGQFNQVTAQNNISTVFQTGSCANAVSPVNIPLSAYSLPGYYTNDVQNFNATGAIAGGTGVFQVARNEMAILDDYVTPVASLTPQTTPGATPADVFNVSTAAFQPSSGPLTISVVYDQFPGNYSLTVKDMNGYFAVTLDSRVMAAPVSFVYRWNGLDKYGSPCPEGVYVVDLVEPFDHKMFLLNLIR